RDFTAVVLPAPDGLDCRAHTSALPPEADSVKRGRACGMIDSEIRAVFFDAVGTLLFPRAPISRTYAEHAYRHGVSVTEGQVRLAFREAFARLEEVDAAAGWRTDEARERARWRAIVADVLQSTVSDACFIGLWEWFATPAAWVVPSEAGDVLRSLADRGLLV